MLGAPRQFAFIPAAPVVVAPAIAAIAEVTAAGGAAAVVAPPLAVPLLVAGVVAAGSIGLAELLARATGGSLWGSLNSRPGSAGVLPPDVNTWPEGQWNPKGGNRWTWTITGTHWGPDPAPSNQTRTFFWDGGPGRVAWLQLGPAQMSHNGVLEYDDGRIHEGPSMGVDGGNGLMGFLRSGGFLQGSVVRATVTPNSGTGEPFPPLGTPFPDGWAPPAIAPLPRPSVLPSVKPAAVPGQAPEPLPDALPSPVPVGPGVVAPAEVGTAGRPALLPPVPGSATATGTDGRPVPRPGPLVPTTPSDVHFPGGIPITSNPPQPTLEGIAQEVGRIENKLNKLLAPGTTDVPDWIGLAWRIWDFLSSASDAGEYSLHGTCERDVDGNPIDSTRQFPWGGSFGAIGNVASRVDAIAEMLQYSKELKQPICRGSGSARGEFVSVNFESDAPSIAGQKPLRKLLRYRDQTAAPLEAHVAHWADFSWLAGPVIVANKGGVWGEVQVWAANADEGKRVIRHAAAIAGVNLADPAAAWIVTGSTSARYGQTGVMRVRRLRNGAWMISKRLTPDGNPEYLVPAPTPPAP